VTIKWLWCGYELIIIIIIIITDIYGANSKNAAKAPNGGALY